MLHLTPNPLTPQETERLRRFRESYNASTALDMRDYHAGARVTFMKWLVAEGRVSDGPMPRCDRCGRRLVILAPRVLEALEHGWRIISFCCGAPRSPETGGAA